MSLELVESLIRVVVVAFGLPYMTCKTMPYMVHSNGAWVVGAIGVKGDLAAAYSVRDGASVASQAIIAGTMTTAVHEELFRSACSVQVWAPTVPAAVCAPIRKAFMQWLLKPADDPDEGQLEALIVARVHLTEMQLNEFMMKGLAEPGSEVLATMQRNVCEAAWATREFDALVELLMPGWNYDDLVQGRPGTAMPLVPLTYLFLFRLQGQGTPEGLSRLQRMERMFEGQCTELTTEAGCAGSKVSIAMANRMREAWGSLKQRYAEPRKIVHALFESMIKYHADLVFEKKGVQGGMANCLLAEMISKWLRPLLPHTAMSSLQAEDIQAVAQPITLSVVTSKLGEIIRSQTRTGSAAASQDDDEAVMRPGNRQRGSQRNRKRARSARQRATSTQPVDVSALHAAPPPAASAATRRGRGGRARGAGARGRP